MEVKFKEEYLIRVEEKLNRSVKTWLLFCDCHFIRLVISQFCS